MLRNTIFGRFCVAAIMVLIVKKVVSILRHSYFRVTEYVLVGVIVIVCCLVLVISILRDPLHSGV